MADMKELITEHIDIWTAAECEKKSSRGRSSGNAGSVYGVKKLRELILELAVCGKLVPQDQNDEPASELLKRIQAEKAKLIAEGKLKKEKPLTPISDDEKPFELPNGWEFVCLETISDINGGFAFKSTSYTEHGVRVIRISDFDEKGFKDDKIVRYKYSPDLEQYRLAPKNILMAMTGGTVGKCYLVKELMEDMVVNQRVATIKLLSPVLAEYISNVLQTTSVQSVIQEAKNSTNDNISMLDIKEFNVPLPPLAEQHRIVAKVDELMALCDQLEAQHINASEAHETSVSQLLATLTHPQKTTPPFAQRGAGGDLDWQRIYANFDVLFTTESSIDALKQTLLQLAVMGKLVPQDPNDEPASELLKRIQAEKAKLIAEGKLKKEKSLAPITDDEKPFALPKGREWVRMDFLNPDFQNGVSSRGDADGVPIVVLRLADINERKILLDDPRELKISSGMIEKYRLKTGDILIVRVNGSADLVGGFVLSESEINAIYCDHFIRMRISQDVLNPSFLGLVGASSLIRDRIKDMFITTAGQKTVNQTHISSLIIPLIPLAEQHRIVAKVDALMALCDQLKTRIQQASQQQQAIADALVAQSVA